MEVGFLPYFQGWLFVVDGSVIVKFLMYFRGWDFKAVIECQVGVILSRKIVPFREFFFFSNKKKNRKSLGRKPSIPNKIRIFGENRKKTRTTTMNKGINLGVS